MERYADIRWLISKSHSRIEADRAMLQRMAQDLSETYRLIERAKFAYQASLWTLEKIERYKFNSHLNDPNPLPLRASPLAFSDS
jgi:hypothetical protein